MLLNETMFKVIQCSLLLVLLLYLYVVQLVVFNTQYNLQYNDLYPVEYCVPLVRICTYCLLVILCVQVPLFSTSLVRGCLRLLFGTTPKSHTVSAQLHTFVT